MLKWTLVITYNDVRKFYPAASGREAVAMADDAWVKLTDEKRAVLQEFYVGLLDGKEAKSIIYDRLHDLEGKRIEKIVEASGMNLATFSRKFGIPYRSLQHWVGGDREAPDYVLDMLEKVVLEYCE